MYTKGDMLILKEEYKEKFVRWREFYEQHRYYPDDCETSFVYEMGKDVHHGYEFVRYSNYKDDYVILKHNCCMHAFPQRWFIERKIIKEVW